MKLLIAEDDPRLLKSLIYIFENNRYIVDGVSDGDAAFDYAITDEYDGIIMDIMMPGKDGIEVLKRLRKEKITTPVLFLTAKTEVEQRVEGLDAGADDYLPKPFSSQELLARVRAMLRRKDNFTADIIEHNGLSLNRSTYQLCSGKNILSLSGKEFQIMEMLIQRPGTILPTEQIISRIWGWDTDVDTSVVWVHISNLRKKLAALDCAAEIRFIRSGGYMLEVKE